MSEKLTELFIKKLKSVLSMSLANEFNISKEADLDNYNSELLDQEEYVVYKQHFSNQDACEVSVLISKEYTAKLADLMVMGDGTAEFSDDEHLDAIKELYDQVLGSFSTDILSTEEIELKSESSSANTIKKEDLDAEATNLFLLKFEDDNQYAVLSFSKMFLDLFKTQESGKGDTSPSHNGLDKFLNNPNMKNLLDTNIEIEIFYGNTQRKIEDILLFNDTTILELNDLKDEAVDIYVNGKIFAKGKVVVINKSYSVEIKKIISIKERLLSLKS
jgi:flagellar motor switch protein FliN